MYKRSTSLVHRPSQLSACSNEGWKGLGTRLTAHQTLDTCTWDLVRFLNVETLSHNRFSGYTEVVSSYQALDPLFTVVSERKMNMLGYHARYGDHNR